jgi:putative ABC transport system substrate-binding protein
MHKILAVGVKWEQRSRPLANAIGSGRLGEARPLVQGLVQGLQALGHVPGTSFDLDVVEEEPQDLVRGVRAALAASKPDVIFAISNSALRAARAATHTIPIVFPNISDPWDHEEGKGRRYIKSVAVPGTNVTGTRTMLRQTAPDCLGLFKATIPSLTRVVLLGRTADFHPKEAAREMTAHLRRAAQDARLRLEAVPFRTRNEIADRLALLSQDGPAGRPRVGVLVLPDDLAISERMTIVQKAHSKGIPTFFPLVEFVNTEPHSALAAYGIPPHVSGRAAAEHVHKVLAGARPGDLPVKRLGGFEWAVNTAVARALNITIPDHVLKAADRVV